MSATWVARKLLEGQTMSRKGQMLKINAALDGHFAANDISPADQDRWREPRGTSCASLHDS
jgi:hypothetical protein